MSTTKAIRTSAGDDYMELIRKFPLRAIRNERELRQAYEAMDELAMKGTLPRGLSKGETDYLDALCIICKEYEDRHVDMREGKADAIDVLHELLEQRQMSASDLGRLLGNRPLGGAILRRQRQLSKANIRRLAEHFHVRADIFL